MIETGKALAYVQNGLQFIRLQIHEWSDTHSMGLGTEIGGRNEGSGPNGALQGVSLDALADFFSSSIEGAFSENNEILNISDCRLMASHTTGMGLMRSNMNQLALTSPEPGFNTIPSSQFRFKYLVSLFSFLKKKKGNMFILVSKYFVLWNVVFTISFFDFRSDELGL